MRVPEGGFVATEIFPPASKSYSHRALNLAWLSGQPTRVFHLLQAEDLELFRSALTRAGWQVLSLSPSGDWRLDPPPAPLATTVDVYCGNAGTMFRFLAATLATVPGTFRLDGSQRLRERPIGPLVDAVRQLGGKVEYLERDGFAPLLLHGETLRGGRCRLDAGSSSQYLSALLMACSFAAEPSEIEVTALTSQPYVEVTLDAMRKVGLDTVARQGDAWQVQPRPPGWSLSEQRIEADDSAVAYPVAAAMISGRPVVLRGLRRHSIQGDRRFLRVLEQMGAELEWRENGDLWCGGTVASSVDVDLSGMPDQVPTLAAVAAFAPGTTRITNVPHLRIKESDRLAVMAQELGRVGVDVEELPDGLVIVGDPERLRGWRDAEDVVVDPHDDHRIAMSLALVGLRRPGVSIDDPATVGKSYPGFWRDLFGSP